MEQQKKPLCIISKETYGEYGIRDIQTNSAWSANPYPNYAVVQETMAEDILATGGFCDIVLNPAGTEVVSFEAKAKPEIPEPPQEPTQLDRIEVNTSNATDAQLIIMEAMADEYEQHQADRLNDMDVQATIYEEILALKEASGAV